MASDYPIFLKQLNILYIEDVTFNKDFMLQTTRKFNHEGDLIFVTNIELGSDAIRNQYSVKKKTFDLVFLDLNVPDRTNANIPESPLEEGTTIPLIRKIRGFNHPFSKVPIIVVTNESSKDKLLLTMEAGADKIIGKMQESEKTISIIIDLFKKRYGNPDEYFLNRNKK